MRVVFRRWRPASELPTDITVVVTDSGLGGLSTAADLYCKCRTRALARRVRLVFFNALADYSRGYNMMARVEEKVEVFNNALRSMADRFQPDIIFIACNTLSVLYEQTAVAQAGLVPIVGIVDTSVQLMLEELRRHWAAYIIILGTPTTIASETYPRRLVDAGIPRERIVPEACSTLQMAIELDAGGEETMALIRRHIGNAIAMLPDTKTPVIVSYNCTHFGYADTLIRSAFADRGVPVVAWINPNTRMTDTLFTKSPCFERPEVSAQVISQVAIDPAGIRCVARLIAPTSPEVADALRRYTHEPHLFAWY